ncbi:HAD subfamily IIID h [Suillus bovinus]|uniref:HAD subfamily IIID h n=1 Tax=Suillus bovinus TaxID=48563 RepID=UPI001B876A4B|nr:HAD subfamily IIID h [Suillus bovinus]KAG2146868.1 HAD subfamily IIID h [Suillus bovinus]
MATMLEDEIIPETKIPLTFKWSGREYKVDLLGSDRVYDLKTSLMSLTKVPPERQKILGLVKGKLPPDQERIADLRIAGKSFTLIGTPEGDEIKDPSKLEFLPDVVNDLDVDFTDNPTAAATYKNDQRNIRKVKEATEKLQINIIHPLRDGKRLLVLDIDYTILDTKPLTSGSLPPAECARPGLHEFLEAIYPYYDICIWSQTSWIWLEAKLVELGMVGSTRNYQVLFALQIIWNHFPQFSAKNSIHIDDLSRNFALNPNEGLKIHAFKNAHTEQAQADRELHKLARYLVHIAAVEDFRTLRHKAWKHELRRLTQS